MDVFFLFLRNILFTLNHYWKIICYWNVSVSIRCFHINDFRVGIAKRVLIRVFVCAGRKGRSMECLKVLSSITTVERLKKSLHSGGSRVAKGWVTYRFLYAMCQNDARGRGLLLRTFWKWEKLSNFKVHEL